MSYPGFALTGVPEMSVTALGIGNANKLTFVVSPNNGVVVSPHLSKSHILKPSPINSFALSAFNAVMLTLVAAESPLFVKISL